MRSRRTAHHVGAKWADELERDSLRVSSLLGTRVANRSGEAVGRVHEVQGRLEGSLSHPGALHITGVVVGKGGWAQRLMGVDAGAAPSRETGLIEWSDLLGWHESQLVVP